MYWKKAEKKNKNLTYEGTKIRLHSLSAQKPWKQEKSGIKYLKCWKKKTTNLESCTLWNLYFKSEGKSVVTKMAAQDTPDLYLITKITVRQLCTNKNSSKGFLELKNFSNTVEQQKTNNKQESSNCTKKGRETASFCLQPPTPPKQASLKPRELPIEKEFLSLEREQSELPASPVSWGTTQRTHCGFTSPRDWQCWDVYT